jgi:hypothetical protein
MAGNLPSPTARIYHKKHHTYLDSRLRGNDGFLEQTGLQGLIALALQHSKYKKAGHCPAFLYAVTPT